MRLTACCSPIAGSCRQLSKFPPKAIAKAIAQPIEQIKMPLVAAKNPGAKPLIGIVGPCSAGKSTLIAGLKTNGYSARHIAQEHSFVPSMWQRLVDPQVLIYLDVSYPVSMRRRPLDLSESEFAGQSERLRHARQHAGLYIHTDSLTAAEVLERVLGFLKQEAVPIDSKRS
jgi:hypothetical protein